MIKYVHGYSNRESKRLQDQAQTLSELLHYDTIFSEGEKVLEAGCGIGSQTKIIATNNPNSEILSIDISAASLAQASKSIDNLGIKNVRFQQTDLYNPGFKKGSFDHIFVCFVLEHLPNPLQALETLKELLVPGGRITVIEGDHGSTYFYPSSPWAQKAVQCLIDLQDEHGGNSLIGRELFPLLTQAGFHEVKISPRMVYVDASKPKLVEGFTKNTFTAMVEGVTEEVLSKEMMSEREWRQGIQDLYRCAEEDGVFCYTFFKANAIYRDG